MTDLNPLSEELVAEWHPTLNSAFDQLPSAHSTKKAWWLGKCGHEWESLIASRSRGLGCPYCSGRRILVGFNDLATTSPLLATEWHPRNKVKVSEYSRGSHKKVWWLGKCGHEWEASIKNRALHFQGCPYCSGKRVLQGFNDLTTTHPHLAKQWHPTKNNKLLPTQISVGSSKKAWWLGSCGHEWEAVVSSRIKNGCPICANQIIVAGINDLATTYPGIAAEWHPTKNKDLLPTQVSAGSNRKIWWQCSLGHEWVNTVSSRVQRRRGCPYCCNQKVLAGFNDLATTNPALASQWHPTKNGKLTPQMVTAGANKYAWWLCEEGHEWRAHIGSRNAGRGCGQCWVPLSREEEKVVAAVLPGAVPTTLPLRFKRRSMMQVDGLLGEVVVEYDGRYWHQGKKEHDREKTMILLDAGYRVIRVRNALPSLDIDHPHYLEVIIGNVSNDTLRHLRDREISFL